MTSDFKFRTYTEINLDILQWTSDATELKYFKQDYKYVTEKSEK